MFPVPPYIFGTGQGLFDAPPVPTFGPTTIVANAPAIEQQANNARCTLGAGLDAFQTGFVASNLPPPPFNFPTTGPFRIAIYDAGSDANPTNLELILVGGMSGPNWGQLTRGVEGTGPAPGVGIAHAAGSTIVGITTVASTLAAINPPAKTVTISVPTTIVVDSVNGNDLSAAGPFKTIKALNAYLNNSTILAKVTINVPYDPLPGDDPAGFAFTCPQANGGSIAYIGVAQILASSVITAATNAITAQLGRRQTFDDKALGANNGWAPYVGKQIVVASGARVGNHTWIASIPTILPGIVSVANGSTTISFFKNASLEPTVAINQTIAAGTVVQFASQAATNYTIVSDVVNGATATITPAYSGTTNATTTTTVQTGSTCSAGQPVKPGARATGWNTTINIGDAYNILRPINIKLGRFTITTDALPQQLTGAFASGALLSFQNFNFLTRSDGSSCSLQYGNYLFTQCSFPGTLSMFQAYAECFDCYLASGYHAILSALVLPGGVCVMTSKDQASQLIIGGNVYMTGSRLFVAPGLGYVDSLVVAPLGANGVVGAQFQDCNDSVGQGALVFHTCTIGLGANFGYYGTGKIWGSGNVYCGMTLYYGANVAATTTANFQPTVTGQAGDAQFDNVHAGGFSPLASAYDGFAAASVPSAPYPYNRSQLYNPFDYVPTGAANPINTQPGLFTPLRNFTWTLFAASVANGGFNYSAHKNEIKASLIGI